MSYSRKVLQSSEFYHIINIAELKHLCDSTTKRGDVGGQIMSQQERFEEGRILTVEGVAEIGARKQATIRVAQGVPGTQTRHLRISTDVHTLIAGVPQTMRV